MGHNSIKPSLNTKPHPVKPPFPHSPLSKRLVIHHKVRRGGVPWDLLRTGEPPTPHPYGVSPQNRVLSPGLFLRNYDQVVYCLDKVLGLTNAQSEVVLRLLRLWAYYGEVYPTEAQITADPGCSKATFWRTVRQLRERGLLEVINRFVLREHAQISNLYRLDGLILVIARFLADKLGRIYAEWTRPFLMISWPNFWTVMARGWGSRAAPSGWR